MFSFRQSSWTMNSDDFGPVGSDASKRVEGEDWRHWTGLVRSKLSISPWVGSQALGGRNLCMIWMGWRCGFPYLSSPRGGWPNGMARKEAYLTSDPVTGVQAPRPSTDTPPTVQTTTGPSCMGVLLPHSLQKPGLHEPLSSCLGPLQTYLGWPLLHPGLSAKEGGRECYCRYIEPNCSSYFRPIYLDK